MNFNLLAAGISSAVSNWTAPVITILILCVIMMLANLMRKKIKFLSASLLPTAVIGAFLALIIKVIFDAAFGINIFHEQTLNIITYHFLAVGFIALTLRVQKKKTAEQKAAGVSPVRTGAFLISTYLFQAIIGITLTVILGFIFSDLVTGSGLLLPFGFGQGPGQANNTGLSFDTYNGTNVYQSLGIAIAAMGFIWASIGGVIALNVFNKKRKKAKIAAVSAEDVPLTSIDEVENKNEIPLSDSIDKFTVQVCLIGFIYLLTYGLLIGLEQIVTPIAPGIMDTIWGFNFLIAVLVTFAVKFSMKGLQKKNIMKKQYQNNFLLNRISGFAFDFMIISSVSSIKLDVFSSPYVWITLLVLTTVGGFFTWWYVRFISKKVYKNYDQEAFLGFYGNLTGTAANGVALLKELDPNYTTPVTDDLVNGSALAIIMALPLLFLVAPLASSSSNIPWAMAVLVGYSAVLMYIVFRKAKKKKTDGEGDATTETAVEPPAELTVKE